MIADAMIALLCAWIDLASAALPDWDFLNPFAPTSWYIPTIGGLTGSDGGDLLQIFGAWGAKYNAIIPVQEAYALLLIYLGLQAALFAFQVARFALNIVRGSGA